ncbi:MAG: hypothetical protein RIQ81_2281 [Pseudomonadota bacterium]
MRSYRSSIALVAVSGAFAWAGMAAGAPVPKDPELEEYRDSVSAKYDKDVVSHEGDSGMTLAFGIGFGQARPTQSGGAPGIAFQAGIEPGYTSQTGRFNRIEASAELFFGRAGFTLAPASGDEKVTLPIKFGMMAKFGLGSAASQSSFSTWKIGVGPVFASYSGERDNGDTVESTETIVGLAAMIGYHYTFNFSKNFGFNVGGELRHMEFDVSPAETVEAGTRNTTRVKRIASVNIPQIVIGPRIKF